MNVLFLKGLMNVVICLGFKFVSILLKPCKLKSKSFELFQNKKAQLLLICISLQY